MRKRDKVKQAVDEEEHTFAFKVDEVDEVLVSGVKEKGLMVDTGATSHIIRDIAQFKDFDSSFEPHKHVLELADGERISGIALKKSTAKVRLRDNKGGISGGNDADWGVVRPIFSTGHLLSQGSDVPGSNGHLQRRRNNPPPAPVNILGTDVDVVESYKRLRSFGVQGPLLRTFYASVVGSAIFYGIVCWSSSITDRDRRRMDRLVRRASSVLGCPLDSVEVDTLTALGSSFRERLLHPRCVKERYRTSFLPAAVRLHNKHNAR
ncbi:hypothetical protein D4764_01G0009790 [Takifugu flavidus]|uniref:Uncharacterized protein n=1 Tax=Takifugu flavidus TaxID=433684 RepID=A0A5C6PN63_9TELE|nr:hypothetical protein D4764_01G0009790 [Takifugu flavidus]